MDTPTDRRGSILTRGCRNASSSRYKFQSANSLAFEVMRRNPYIRLRTSHSIEISLPSLPPPIYLSTYPSFGSMTRCCNKRASFPFIWGVGGVVLLRSSFALGFILGASALPPSLLAPALSLLWPFSLVVLACLCVYPPPACLGAWVRLARCCRCRVCGVSEWSGAGVGGRRFRVRVPRFPVLR